MCRGDVQYRVYVGRSGWAEERVLMELGLDYTFSSIDGVLIFREYRLNHLLLATICIFDRGLRGLQRSTVGDTL